MAINLVRKPSEIPNISNHDDYKMFRYATGGYNGVVEKYGNECNYEINGNTFKIKSGEIVIDGIQSKIDSVGVSIAVDNITGTEYYTVYCEVNLSLIDNQKTEIKATKNTVNYPVIEKGDDLTENQTGIARLELYRFQVNNGVISDVVKRFEVIDYGKSKQAENSYKINNLEIIRDENGILKIGDIVIPQKKLIFDGNADSVDLTSFNITDNEYLEIKSNLNGSNIVKVKPTSSSQVTNFTVFSIVPKNQYYNFEIQFFDYILNYTKTNLSITSSKVRFIEADVNDFYKLKVDASSTGKITKVWRVIE